MKKLLLASILSIAGVAIASANVLDLNYSVTPSGGLFDYSFTLSIDPSYSLNAGDAWSWLIFGDEASATSPIADFSLTSAPPGPFTGGVFSSSGAHNGPTFLFDSSNNIVYWAPTSQSDTLTWTGTSATELTQGQLLYSELLSQNSAPTDSFAVATQAVPAPAGLIALTIGLAGLALLKSRVR